MFFFSSKKSSGYQKIEYVLMDKTFSGTSSYKWIWQYHHMPDRSNGCCKIQSCCSWAQRPDSWRGIQLFFNFGHQSSSLKLTFEFHSHWVKLTFEFHSRWVHLGASQTIATLAQTHPRSNCHIGSHCDALRTKQLHIWDLRTVDEKEINWIKKDEN